MMPAGERGEPGDGGNGLGGGGGGEGVQQLNSPFHSCDSGGDCECLCSAVATYADECARHGFHVRWRSQELCRECALPSIPKALSHHALSSFVRVPHGLQASHVFVQGQICGVGTPF